MGSSAVCRTFWRHGFTLRRNAFVAKEHVREDGVGYGTKVSQNRRSDRLVFVDGFAMNRRGPAGQFHLRNVVHLFPLSHLPCADAPLAVSYFLFFPLAGSCAENDLHTAREFDGLRDVKNPSPTVTITVKAIRRRAFTTSRFNSFKARLLLSSVGAPDPYPITAEEDGVRVT